MMSMHDIRRITAGWMTVATVCVATLGCEDAGPTGPLYAPEDAPSGVSLTDMVGKMTLFNASGNDVANLPNSPFELLYVPPGQGTLEMTTKDGKPHFISTVAVPFTGVPANRAFYMPIATFDDSPPIVGAFPTNEDEAQHYFFDAAQLGGTYSIHVDGEEIEILGEYAAGPVTTEPLPNGGGTHGVVLAVIIRPLPPGEHQIGFDGAFFGDGWVNAFGATSEAHVTYNITVVE